MDDSQELCEPSEEARHFYCRPVIKSNFNDTVSTALVLVKSDKEESSTHFTNTPKSRVEEMIHKFEDKDVNFKDKLANRVRMKEKGIVIKVKKNQIEENSNPQVNNENGLNIKDKINEENNTNPYPEKTSSSEFKLQIDYSDYSQDPENNFLEPLI